MRRFLSDKCLGQEQFGHGIDGPWDVVISRGVAVVPLVEGLEVEDKQRPLWRRPEPQHSQWMAAMLSLRRVFVVSAVLAWVASTS